VVPVRVLLVSTYELGHQPLHLASPAGALLRAGHEVRCADLSVEALAPGDVAWADAVACSVPMHTAMRLALPVCDEVRARRPDVALCLYGLYAGLDGAEGAPRHADLTIAGEYEARLVAWVDDLGARAAAGRWAPGEIPGDGTPRHAVELGRGRSGLPARRLLPGLEHYAQLALGEERRRAGYVEATRGCAHRCRHCPVPVVYDGRTRVTDEDVVVADVAQLVAAGARHVTFGDPDFLNRPRHAERVVAAVHGAFPELTFDVTAKVEHVLAHDALWSGFAAAGCLFVVSAFESASDAILGRLDKGHTVADEIEAVAVLRGAGIEPRPSLLPFTPWTTPADVVALLDLVARCDLVGNVDPVQYAIRLLVPPGSLLVRSGSLDGALGPYDPEHLGWSWRSAHPGLDRLQQALTELAARAGAEGWPARRTYEAVRASAAVALGPLVPEAAPAAEARLAAPLADDDRPRLTEAWFCCAEPSDAQLHAVRASAPVGVGGE